MEITKKELKLLVNNSKEVKKDCLKAIKFMEERIQQARVDLITAEALIEKFG